MSVSKFTIPEKWRETQLKYISEFKSGSTPLRAQHERYFVNGKIPWIKTMDLTNGKITHSNEAITDLAIKETSCPILEPGTVLVAMYGGFNQIGRTGIMTFTGSINQAISALIIDEEKAIPEFVLYWLNTNVSLWRKFAASSRKDPNITRKDVEDFPILLPPLPEQRKIADILSTWDEAIARTERLIAALEQRKKGLMQRLLTGAVRFPEFNDEWRETDLGEFFRPFSRKNTSNEDLTVLSCSTIHGIVPQTTIFGKRIASEDIRRYKVVERGDLIYDPMLLWDASIGFLEVVERGVISPAYSTFKFKKRYGNPVYFKYLLKIHYYRQHYKYISQGTNVRRRKAPVEAFLKLKVILPATIEEQKRITEILQTCDREIDLYTQKLQALKQQKKGLMQKLLTGQVRVKV